MRSTDEDDLVGPRGTDLGPAGPDFSLGLMAVDRPRHKLEWTTAMPRRGSSEDLIAAEEARLGRVLPADLRARLERTNGGDVVFHDETWTLFPVWDATTKRSAGRTASHIARETASIEGAMGDLFPPGATAVADNDAGDYLLIDRDGRTLVWRPETGSPPEPADVDWSRDRAPLRRPRLSTRDRIAQGLAQVRIGPPAVAVVVDTEGSGLYIQFAPTKTGVIGEAIGAKNLPRRSADVLIPYMNEALPRLGWSRPAVGPTDSGNWTREWSTEEWDPAKVASLVMRTAADAYGLDPAALNTWTSTA
jgi:hypothetical protein